MSDAFQKAGSLFDQLRAYLNTRVAQVKLSAAEKASRLAAIMIALLLSALVFFLFLVLLAVALALVLGAWLGQLWIGFAIVAGLVLLSGILIWAGRDRLIRVPVMNALIAALFDREEGEEMDHEKVS
ncbi:MAG: hypothetical protein RJA57_873 [Bacteroidota bacterium]|jgi:uncharacterized membrane protein YdjX (TVP38/TMEM64 family)